MKDHLLNWHERFQPLGPALKTPRIEVDEKSAIAEFERRSFDHPSCTGGNAPSLSPQALVPSPAGRESKVGDRVKVGEYGLGTITEVVRCAAGKDAHYVKFDTYRDCLGNDWSIFWAECLEHIPPSDTQQWVEWKGERGKTCPVDDARARVEIRWYDQTVKTYSAGVICGWDNPGAILAYRVVQ